MLGRSASALIVLVVAAAVGCGASKAPPARTYGAAEASAFVEARGRLAELRKPAITGRTEKIQITLDAPYLPSTVSARGAVAVRPPNALRMIMVGPGGTTAMDLWVTDDRYRFAIPAIGRVLRGDSRSTPEQKRGLPVDFLKWWMLDPLGGEIVAARRNGDALEILLREPSRVTEARIEEDGSIKAHRTTYLERSDGTFRAHEEEWLEASSLGCARATYRQKTTSLTVTATCESTRPTFSVEALKEPKDEEPK